MAGSTTGRRGPLVLALIAGLVIGLAVGLVAVLLVSPGDPAAGDDGPPDERPAGTDPGPEDVGMPARSVILVVGDGMGAAHREAARLDQHGRDGTLVMDSLPVAGFQSTSSADPEDVITDSAAAATAWATGVRTYDGAISVDLDGNPLPTLGAEAKAAGRATGLVTTTAVTNATPAAFFSNSPDRDQEDDIARQYLEVTQPDVILGGGAEIWSPDLVGAAGDAGYAHVTDADELAAADADRLLGLFAEQGMFRASRRGDGAEYDPAVPLADMTAKALDVLSRDPDGFFLVVEEEAVDEMSHINNGELMLEAMRSLEDAVRVARDYAAAHPDTLLIVAGDHDAGGLTVEDPDDSDGGEDGPFPVAGENEEFVLDWTTNGHTGAPTPVTADGPGSEQLAGFYPNTRLHAVMREALTS
jgi:alkaline phosphatase